MLVPNQLIEVRVGVKTLKHYRELGYDVKCFDYILVPPEHLTDGANVIVQVVCDVCGKPMPRKYEHYIYKSKMGIDTCNQCKSVKSKETCIQKYGVENPMQCKEIQNKAKQTNLNKYGTESPMQTKEIQEKLQQSIFDKYGVHHPAQSEMVREKMKQTTLKKYGVEYASQAEEIRLKVQQTVREKYGVDYISQAEEVKKKKKNTFLSQYGVEHALQINSTPVSSQQEQIYQMIKQKYKNAEINYPFSTCSLDVFVNVNGVLIDIEYDGWYWHQEKQKDIKRDKFLQSNGLKTLRIRSGHLLPTEQELFDAIDYLVNTDHHFKEIILSDWKEKEEEECQEQLQAVP